MHYYGELGSSLRDIEDIFSDSLRLLQMIDGEGSFLFFFSIDNNYGDFEVFQCIWNLFLSLKLLRDYQRRMPFFSL